MFWQNPTGDMKIAGVGAHKRLTPKKVRTVSSPFESNGKRIWRIACFLKRAKLEQVPFYLAAFHLWITSIKQTTRGKHSLLVR